MSDNDTIAIYRVVKYTGPRNAVEELVQKSLCGFRVVYPGVHIAATTVPYLDLTEEVDEHLAMASEHLDENWSGPPHNQGTEE